MTAIFVVVEDVRGSAPRDPGTAMQVTARDTLGTIGGGALEHRAIARARNLIMENREAEETVALGPGLGQCCGGSVRLRYTFRPHPVDSDQIAAVSDGLSRNNPASLWLWGAGHVGRAIVRAAPPSAVRITWVDNAPDRFPHNVPEHVATVPSPDMARLARSANAGAKHLIFTYSHDIDLALCDALLRRKVRQIGLIGSETKWARFQSRLRALGHNQDEIARIDCPIGDKSLGKAPQAIAKGVLSALIS